MRDQSFEEALAVTLPAPGARLIDRAELPAGEAIEIDDAAFLFSARFERHGTDLLLTGADGTELVVIDYFAFAPADFVVPGGATLRAHTVTALAGPDLAGGGPEHLVEVQANGASPIGVVETVEGTAQVQRTDGTVEDLQIGEKVFLGDVVFTGEGGLLSLTFVDGTVFTLNENARMTLDELVYAAGASEGNSASFGLVEGSFVFIAGQIAGTGGMDIETPAATLGIRGTTGLIDVWTVGGVLTVEATLVEDPDGGLGRIVLTYPDGRPIAVLDGTETSWRVTLDGEAQEILRTDESRLADDALLNQATAAFFTALDRTAAGETFVPLGGSASGGGDGIGEPGTGDFDTGAGESLGGTENGGTQGGAGGGSLPPDDGTSGGTERDDGGSGGEILPEEPLVPRDIRFEIEEDGSISSTLAATSAGLPEVRLVGAAENGLVAVSRDGSFTYVPDSNFSGTDSFVVRVGTGDTAVESRITIQVAAVNDAPVAEDGEAGLVEDGTASGRLVASDVDGDTLRFSLAEGPDHGTLTLTAEGRWSYLPDPDYSGPDSFSWTASDGEFEDGGVIRLTVTGTEDPIVVTGPTTGSVAEGGTQTATGRLIATDADPEDVPLFEARTLSGSVGRFTISADGGWRYGLDERAEALSEGETITERFSVTARTADGESVVRDVVVRVTGTDDAAEITGAFSGAVTEGDPGDIVTATGAIAVTDADTADAPSFAGASDTGTYGAIAVNEAGDAWTYTLDQAAVQGLGGGETVTDTLTLTDSEGNAQVVTITVTGTDDAAEITGSFSGAVTEGDPGDIVTATGAIAVTDADTADAPSFAGASDTGTYGSIAVNEAGDAWTYTLDQAAVQGLGGGETVTDTLTLTDSEGNTQAVTITVTGTDDAAEITGAFSGAVTEGDPGDVVTATGAIAVTDADTADAPSFAGASDTGTYGSIAVNEAGDAWTYTLDQAAVQGLGGGETVTDTLTLTDSEGNTQAVTITVTGTDDAAEITGAFSGAVTEGDPGDVVTATGAIAVTDADTADAPSFAGASDTGTYGSIAVNEAGGAWTYTLNQAAVQWLGGGETVTNTLTLTDSEGNTQAVTITVTGAEDAPVITGEDAGAVAEDGMVVADGVLDASDADAADSPVFVAGTQAGTYGSLDIGATGAWSYTLDNAAVQLLAGTDSVTETFTVTALTADGESVSRDITITVAGAGDAPVAQNIALITSGEAVEGLVTVSDADAGDTATFGILGDGPLLGELELNPAGDGGFTYTPGEGASGFDQFEIRVTDSEGLSTDISVGVVVGADEVVAENGQDLSIGIDATGSGTSAAGSVTIFTSPPEVVTNNLVLVLDRSGSIGASGWNVLRGQMNEALTTLKERFEDFVTPIKVSLVTYAANSTILADDTGKTSFDLVDDFAALSDLVLSAPYLPAQAGATRFRDAFRDTETLLDAANAEGPQTNYVYFVTDGQPTDSWQTAFANLINGTYTDEAGNTFDPTEGTLDSYDVIVEAFGIGEFLNLPLLESIDDNTATVVSGPSDLADGFSGTALFSAELVGFSLRLVADGEDMGVVADETNPVFSAVATSYSLPLAEVAGLGEKLGDQNLFLAEATFDLDGDPTTDGPGEGLVTVRTAGALGLGTEAVTLIGTARSDLLFGSTRDDTIDGGDGNDLILAGPGDDDLSGGDGNDILIGGEGLDSVHGGAGDDLLDARDGLMAGEVYDGGAGRDVLALLVPEDVDADLLPSLSLSGIEVFDIENRATDVLRLSVEDLLEVTADDDPLAGPGSLTIYGDAGTDDSVVLDPEGTTVTLSETVSDGGDTFDVYRVEDGSGELLASLAVDQDVAVQIVTS